MSCPRLRFSPRSFAWLAPLSLAACVTTAPRPAPPPEQAQAVAQHQACRPAAQGDTRVGNWLGVRKQKGVAGEIRTQIVLQADGSMLYTEQLKRGNRPPQSLEESGCWHAEGAVLVLRTTHSRGLEVDAQDPIYENRYQVQETTAQGLTLRGGTGEPIKLRRTAPDYRLPML